MTLRRKLVKLLRGLNNQGSKELVQVMYTVVFFFILPPIHYLSY